ncbi:MAG TPA: formylglycine-generating enzyme family protein [Candidatus Acidoferrum sp.]
MKTNNAVLKASFMLWSVALLLLSNSRGQSSGIRQADAALKKTATATSAGKIVRNNIGMQLVYVPAGSFMMGSTNAEVQEVYAQAQRDVGTAAKLEWFTREQPRHQVTLRSPFYLGRYEVTQAQWQTVMGSNPSQFRGCELCPVEQISWNDAQEFIRRMNAMNDGFTYSLPSEAQWEYACRAGKTTQFALGNSMSSGQANFDGQFPFGGAAKGVSREKTMPVGSFPPNAWGLYDMHGNVWEFCGDLWHDNYDRAPNDGSAWSSDGDSAHRVERGGSWDFHADALRCAYRFRVRPDTRVNNNGLRVMAVRQPS